MLALFQDLIRNQYESAFRTLKYCIDGCPDSDWNKLVCNHPFSQSVFHSLFFADVYLGPNPEAVEDQPFHKANAEIFQGYEEWNDGPPEKTYGRAFVESYLEHCRNKAKTLIDNFTESNLRTDSGFSWIKGSSAEVQVYNIRHLQHHAAQMSLRLRLDSGTDIPWVKSGWDQ